jgi:hypothetical protein
MHCWLPTQKNFMATLFEFTECNLLREQVRDERDRRCTLPPKVVCLTDQLKSPRRKSVRLAELNEKLTAKKPVALSWNDHCLLLHHCEREFGHTRVPRPPKEPPGRALQQAKMIARRSA